MISLFDKGPFAPCPAPFNMAAHVLKAGQSCPEKAALQIVSTEGAETWTYAKLRQAVLGTATGLLEHGLCPGQIVLMRLGNTVDFPIAYLGALAAGLVPVPTSSALTAPETQTLIDTVSPAVVLKAEGIACAPFTNNIHVEDLRRYRGLPPAVFHMGDPDRLGYIIFTSGTSGKPRAVAHAHRAIWARQMMFRDWYDLSSEDRVLHAGAFNWTYTLGTGLMDPWTVGATALIPAAGTPSTDLPSLLAKYHASIFAAAPGVYRQLMARDVRMDIPSLRHGLSAGEKLPETVAQKWRARTAKPIYEAYGMSECSTFISQRPQHESAAHTLGLPQVGRRVALLHDGQPVPLGQEGTIAVDRKDPGVMLGYFGDPEATQARMAGTWFLTGDQAIMHEDGAIEYLGRNDDMMNAGGFRVSPVEVEAVLIRHHQITSVAVTEVTVKADTQVIAAFYTAADALDEGTLHAYVSDRLARYKQPRLYIHLPQLPYGANGKILRRQLSAHFEGPS